MEMFPAERKLESRVFMPAFNLYKENGNIVIEANVPGYTKEEIKVEVKENILTVSGEHKEEKEVSEKDYYHKEFQMGSFSRSVNLPSGITTEDIKAKYSDGILRLSMPSKEETKTEEVSTINVE